MRIGRTTIALGLVLVLQACGVPQEKYDALLSRNGKLQAELAKERKDKTAMQGKLSGLESDLADVRAKLALRDKALSKSRGSLRDYARLKRKMAAQRALNARLRNAFKGMISAGQLKVVNVNGRLVIKMASRILFRPGRAKLTRRGKKAIRRIGKILSKVKRHFQVAGHTDNKPVKKSKYKNNWLLSAARAANVVRVLRKAGMPGINVSAAAFGQFQPVSSNRTRTGRRLNRRIEITLLPVIPRKFK